MEVDFSRLFLLVMLVLFETMTVLSVSSDYSVPEMKCVCDGGCESVLEADCPWGLTLDVCGCCFLCARGKGEPCGGVHGTCAIGLRCHFDQWRITESTKQGTCKRERRKGRRK